MKISEIFVSIQGEGTHTGELCAFFRLWGCGFGCFYCDTKYANSEEYEEFSIDELLEKAKNFGVKLVEITGGEPLEQEETPLFAQKLLENGFDVLTETNGSKNIGVLPEKVVKIVDVKLPWIGQKEHFYYENLKYLSENDELKFVIDGKKGYDWAKKFIETQKIPCKVIFSPCETKDATFSATTLAEAIISDRLNVRFGLQLHKLLWEGRRGI